SGTAAELSRNPQVQRVYLAL
ncbi:MAG: hypothetical protein C4298_01815, partial [Thermus sp.]